jgi:hypothetical protein
MTTRNPIQIKRLYIEINFHLLYAVSGYHNKTRPIGSTETFPTDQILGRFTALKAYHLKIDIRMIWSLPPKTPTYSSGKIK